MGQCTCFGVKGVLWGSDWGTDFLVGLWTVCYVERWRRLWSISWIVVVWGRLEKGVESTRVSVLRRRCCLRAGPRREWRVTRGCWTRCGNKGGGWWRGQGWHRKGNENNNGLTFSDDWGRKIEERKISRRRYKVETGEIFISIMNFVWRLLTPACGKHNGTLSLLVSLLLSLMSKPSPFTEDLRTCLLAHLYLFKKNTLLLNAYFAASHWTCLTYSLPALPWNMLVPAYVLNACPHRCFLTLTQCYVFISPQNPY